MTNLIASLVFLLAPATTTNTAVLDDRGNVVGWWSASLTRPADVTLANNRGIYILQWRSLDVRTWLGVAVVYGDRTNRVQVPTQGGYLRLMHREY